MTSFLLWEIFFTHEIWTRGLCKENQICTTSTWTNQLVLSLELTYIIKKERKKEYMVTEFVFFELRLLSWVATNEIAFEIY